LDRKILKINEPITDQGVLRVWTNYKRRELHKNGCLVAVIKRKSLK
jgi:hypothetical protein